MNLRVFVASPGDVGEEREITARVLERLQYEFGPRVGLEPILWEHEPLRATASFQEEIPLPSQADIVVFILWSRLGTRLPPGKFARPDGTSYASGTEFEFEDAKRSFEEKGTPDLLVYRKTTRPSTELDSEERVLERMRQKRALDDFLEHWFKDVEGSFKAAFHTFDTPARFEERLEEHLRSLIDARLRRQPSGEPAPARPRWQRGSPFRGLQSFEIEHAPVFCGRTSQISDVLNALRRQEAAGKPFVLVTGMSGCGKSSLVRAGVLPVLTCPNVIEGIGLWRRASFVPGNSSGDLFDGLAQALLADPALQELRQSGTGIHELAMLLRERPATAVPLLRSGLSQAAREVQRLERLEREPKARLALLVDQMEEIFTIERFTAAERQRFDAALAALVRSGTVWVLCTLRSDFYHRCAELPELMSLKEGAGQYDLRSPGAAEVGQIIRQPARIAGLRFEEDARTGERLDDVLRDAAVKDPAALPLLEFTLDELYKRQTDDGLLTFAAYRELEGVEGALAHRAEEVFAGLPAPAQAALPAVLSALVTLSAEEEGAVARRRAPLAAFASREAKALVDAFTEHRLLVTDRAQDGSPVVSIAHEALLQRWPRARQWLADNEELLRTRARIQSAAALWRQEGEGAGFLIPEGKLLRDAAALLADPGGHLGEDEAKLVRASLAAAQAGRRRQTLWRAAAAAAVLLAFVAAWAVWYLYFRDYVTYYNRFVKRFGQPVGVGEVAGSDVRHRQWALRFTQRGRRGPVVRVEAVNGSGYRTPFHAVARYISGAQLDPLKLGEVHCAWIFDHDAEGNLLREKAESCTGRRVYEFQYKGEPTKDGVVTAEFTRDGIAAPQAQSGAALVQFARDKEGFDKKIWYLDSAGQRKPGPDGSYGMSFEDFDNDTGLPRRLVNLGPDGYAAFHRDGWVEQSAEYDESGRVVEVTYSGRQGARVLTRQGFARQTLKYDRYGNVEEIRSFDERNLPVRGVALQKPTYDEKGNLIRVAFFDGEERSTYDSNGSFGVALEYDERGRLKATTPLDESGHPMLTRYGVARVGIGYDDKGNVAALSFFDDKGKPVHRAGGFARWAFKYDEKGNRIEEVFLDERGKPVRAQNGFARKQLGYDPRRDVVIEEAYFDATGNPASNEEGVAKWRSEYDPERHMERRLYLDQAGEPMLSLRGASERWIKSDELGNVVEESYHGFRGEPVVTTDGFATRATTFNEQGVPTRVSYFGPNGQPVPVKHEEKDERGLTILALSGCAGIEKGYDVRGTLSEVTCLDERGEPAISAEGHTTVKLHYDDRGHPVGQSFLDANGNPAVGRDGIARIRWRCDRFGNPIEETYFDPSGQPTLHAGGYAKVARKYDAWGSPVEERFLDKEGRLVRAPAGYARAVTRYGTRGEPLEFAYFDEQGFPTRTQSGAGKITFRYDGKGKVVEVAFFDEHGEPVATGAARKTIEYDLSGREEQVVFYDRWGNVLGRQSRQPLQTAAVPQPVVPQPAAPRVTAEPQPKIAQAPSRPAAREPAATTRPDRGVQGAAAEPAPRAAPAAAPALPAEPSVGDLEATISALVAGSERVRESYEEFEEAAGELRKAFRRATGQGGGIRNLLHLNRPGSSQAAGLLQQRKSELTRRGSIIDGLVRTYPLGPEASGQWQEIRRNLRRLDQLVP
jgi:hypothetical protein